MLRLTQPAPIITECRFAVRLGWQWIAGFVDLVCFVELGVGGAAESGVLRQECAAGDPLRNSTACGSR